MRCQMKTIWKIAAILAGLLIVPVIVKKHLLAPATGSLNLDTRYAIDDYIGEEL